MSSRTGKFTALALALVASPLVAQANDIRVSSYEMSETGGVVVLESSAPLGQPWMRIDGNGVRVWFPDMAHVARFDHAREADEPIRGLQLRPGADDSAVLRLALGKGRKLTRDEIEITRNGSSARVEVRFAGARPAAAAAAPPAAKPEPSRTVAQPVATTPAPAAPARPSGAAAAFAAPTAQAAPPPPQAPADSPNPNSTSAIRTLAAAASGDGSAPALGLASGGTDLGALLVLSGLLFCVYLGIRAYAKKHTPKSADIQVVSARRLGHRSEVIVVRALGADHLLVTSAGRVERVASVPTANEPQLSTAALPPSAAPASAAVEAEAASQANGLGIISKLSSSYRVRKLLDAVDHESPEPPPQEPARAHDNRRPAFGPELLSAMHQHKLTNLSALPGLGHKQSEAVAGIARLRSRSPN